MKPKAPKKDSAPPGYKWEDVTIKISGTPIKPIDTRCPISFEVKGDYPIEVGMECDINQPGAEWLNGKYVITEIKEGRIYLDPKILSVNGGVADQV